MNMASHVNKVVEMNLDETLKENAAKRTFDLEANKQKHTNDMLEKTKLFEQNQLKITEEGKANERNTLVLMETKKLHHEIDMKKLNTDCEDLLMGSKHKINTETEKLHLKISKEKVLMDLEKEKQINLNKQVDREISESKMKLESKLRMDEAAHLSKMKEIEALRKNNLKHHETNRKIKLSEALAGLEGKSTQDNSKVNLSGVNYF